MAPLETIGPFQNATEGRHKMITEEAMTLSFRCFVFSLLTWGNPATVLYRQFIFVCPFTSKYNFIAGEDPEKEGWSIWFWFLNRSPCIKMICDWKKNNNKAYLLRCLNSSCSSLRIYIVPIFMNQPAKHHTKGVFH